MPSQSEGDRAQLIRSLLAVRQKNADIVPSVARILGSWTVRPSCNGASSKMLGDLPDSGVGDILTEAYPKLPGELQDAVLNHRLYQARRLVADAA